MEGLLGDGNEVFISKNDDPKRKLKYTLEIIKVKKNLVGSDIFKRNKGTSQRVAEYFSILPLRHFHRQNSPSHRDFQLHSIGADLATDRLLTS